MNECCSLHPLGECPEHPWPDWLKPCWADVEGDERGCQAPGTSAAGLCVTHAIEKRDVA